MREICPKWPQRHSLFPLGRPLIIMARLGPPNSPKLRSCAADRPEKNRGHFLYAHCTTAQLASVVMQEYNHAQNGSQTQETSPEASKARKRRFPGRRWPTSRSLRLAPAALQRAAGAFSDPLQSCVRHVQAGAPLNALCMLLT